MAILSLPSEDFSFVPARADGKKSAMDALLKLLHENAALKGRLDAATARTKQMLDRVRFIRQQSQSGAEK